MWSSATQKERAPVAAAEVGRRCMWQMEGEAFCVEWWENRRKEKLGEGVQMNA